jgi:hypothetical protein
MPLAANARRLTLKKPTNCVQRSITHYFDRYGLIWDLTKIDSDPLKAERLIAEMDFGAGPTFNIILKGGALDPQPHDVSVPTYRLKRPAPTG